MIVKIKTVFKKALSVMIGMGILAGALTLGGNSFAAVYGGVNNGYEPSGTPVSTVDEFLAMDPSGVYYLANDIDFSGKEYSTNVYGKSFKGVLDGNGHSLLGIKVSAKNSDAGIFGNNFGGTVMNLTIGSESDPASVSSTGAQYSVAGLAATFASDSTVNISNLCVYAEIAGDGKTAGLTSYMNKGTINVENCEVYGSVTGNPASGYICMSPDSQTVTISIKNSANYASVSGKNLSAGGFYATHASVSASRVCHLTVSGCVNYGAISATDWRAGGIVGEFNESKSSTLTVDHCCNLGVITMTGAGGMAAGIVGGMAFDAPTGQRIIKYCYNAGVVMNTASSSEYALAFSNQPGDKVIAENCAYIDGQPVKNVRESGISSASTPEEMLAAVAGYPESGDEISFTADTIGINNGYPLLSWQVTSHDNVKEFECGRKVCLDCGAILSTPGEEKHAYEETVVAPDGYSDGMIRKSCKYCGDTEVSVGERSRWSVEPENGSYVISEPEQFLWYASDLKLGLLTGKESILLDSDLDFSELEFIPIGEVNPFCGRFDGNLCMMIGVNYTGDNAAVIAKAGQGAAVTRLSVADSSFTGTTSAGAVVGSVERGSVVRLTDIAVTGCKIDSDNTAGGVVGDSSRAANFSVKNCSVDSCEIAGENAGGIVGNGESATLTNCYANAEITGSKTGTLAFFKSALTVKNCGYVKKGKLTKTSGETVDAKSFENGSIAYKINCYGNTHAFGVFAGKIQLTNKYMKQLRVGSAKIYTDKTLSCGGGLSAYRGGDVLIFVLEKNGDIRLVDSQIKVSEKEVLFSDLELTRFVCVDGDYYTAPDGCALYVLENAPSGDLTVNGVQIETGDFSK